ncbi:MAG: hypothetical protein Q7O66_19435, partial [Dehalococcoidia bacterium]|nr:hypothetical protein [Dehalococcoidia bacterium]
MIGNWKRLLAVLGLAVAFSLVWSVAAFGQGAAAGGPNIEASMSASLRGNTAIYSISLKNVSSEPVQDIFVAGSVPEGSKFVRALDTPEGSWFRGFEGAGTSLQSASWLAKSIPANGTAGPFTFVVETGKAT